MQTLAYNELEIRVGTILTDQMSYEQLGKFEKYFEANDDEGAFKWLEQNFPDYKKIVKKEHKALGAEIKAAKNKPALIKGWANK